MDLDLVLSKGKTPMVLLLDGLRVQKLLDPVDD